MSFVIWASPHRQFTRNGPCTADASSFHSSWNFSRCPRFDNAFSGTGASTRCNGSRVWISFSETCLRALQPKLYHVGIRANVSRTTLARAKRKPRLAHLCRVCSRAHPPRAKVVRPRRLWSPTRTDCLGLRFQHHRSVSFPVSMGPLSSAQSRDQAAHLDGPARQHPLLYPHYRGKNARCQSPRPPGVGTRRLLYHGPRIHRLCAAVYLHSAGRFSLLFEPNAIWPIPGVRSDQRIVLCGPQTSKEYPEALRRIEETIGLPEQPIPSSFFDHRPVVSMPLAGGVVLQVDQAAPAHQGLFRYLRERVKDPDLDRHQHVRARGHREEAAASRPQSLRNPANSHRFTIRESRYFTGTYRIPSPKRNRSLF